MISLHPQEFSEFRHLARKLIATGVAPTEVNWETHSESLFGEVIAADVAAQNATVKMTVPKDYLELAELVSLHRDLAKWTLLYRVLYRIHNGERSLLRIDIDDDVRQLRLMEKALRRDMHKMTAFVRFRKIEDHGEDHYVAWHRPDHLIVERMAPWFRNRFGNMRWSILTPERSAHWDLKTLTYGPGAPQISSSSRGRARRSLEGLLSIDFQSGARQN